MKKRFYAEYDMDTDSIVKMDAREIDVLEMLEIFKYYNVPSDKFIKLFSSAMESEYNNITISKNFIDKDTLVIRVVIQYFNCEKDQIRESETIIVEYKKSLGYLPRTMTYKFDDEW